MQQKKDADPQFNALNKREFPANLKQLVQALKPKDLMPSAFAKFGLFQITLTKFWKDYLQRKKVRT